MLTRILIAVAVLLSTACSNTTIKSLSDFNPKPMTKSNVMPSESALENTPYKVVVFDVDDNKVQLAKQSQVGTSVSGELVAQINKSNVVMVKKTGLSDLKTAIENNATDYSDGSAVDFAVTGNISIANYSKKYHKLATYKDKKGKIHVTEPYCEYKALVMGNIYIHDINSMDLVKTIPVSGGADRSIDAANRSVRSCNDLSTTEISSLVRSAGKKAISREDVVFQNHFRPNGYVLERRTNGKSSIFKVTIGQTNGLVKGQKAEFFTVYKNKNPITGKSAMLQSKVAEGAVSNKVQKKSAWIVVDDEEVASKIRLGDVVKITFEKGLLDKLFNRSYSQ
ncbi:MAG TPA: hypothetical protein ENK04_05615 [Gammaproteobacteria bacterium]|nr:hypothetical protein [Gammaproteobacteria bacterium]